MECSIKEKLMISKTLILITLTLIFLTQVDAGDSILYFFDESATGNKCDRDYLCDGLRTCSSSGWCQGTSRPTKGIFYQYDQALTGNKCHTLCKFKDFYCDGNRTCSSAGWC